MGFQFSCVTAVSSWRIASWMSATLPVVAARRIISISVKARLVSPRGLPAFWLVPSGIGAVGGEPERRARLVARYPRGNAVQLLAAST